MALRERIVRDDKPLDAQRISHGQQRVDMALDGVIAARRRTRQPEPGHVGPDRPPMSAQDPGPALPRMQRIRSAMQQDDRHRVVAWPLVAQVEEHAVDRSEL
jgi:hypothetical protein